jgi:tungstate transport system ATP-binding protein
MSIPKYQLSSIRVLYGDTLGVAVDKLTIVAGGLHVVVGSNGSGKSTLLGVLAFLNKPEHGEISFDGVPVEWESGKYSLLRKRVTLLHQNPYMFSGTVAANVAFGLVARNIGKKDTRSVVRESLERVGLPGFEPRNAKRLSGGETRRVALARALACNSEVLLLDEPLAHVDRTSATLLENLVATLASGGITIVMSSHDERWGARLGGKVIHLEDGKLDPAAGQSLYNEFSRCHGRDNANS